jgi:GntR family transcriptional repressor for pyruvate dehydrogenase complex
VSSQTLQSLRQPKRERLSDQISNQIKKLIISKNIQVGDKLPTERELASQLGVSRVVIREALRSLEQAGFIEIRPGQAGGSFVSNKLYKPLFDSIYDLLQDGDLTLEHFYQAREAIEAFNIELAIQNITKKDIKALKEVNKKLLEDIREIGKYHYHNMAFHIKIAEITGNPLLKLMVGALLSILKVIYPNPRQSEDFVKALYQRHLGIINAIEKKDIELSKKLVIEDVSYTAKLKDLSRMNARP